MRALALQPVLYPSAGVATKGLHEPGINDLIYRPPINQDWLDAWNVSEAEIEMTEQNVRAHHGLFLLVIIGTGVQVAPNPAFQAGYLRAVGGTDLLYPTHRLTALGVRKGFTVLDLVAPMKALRARPSSLLPRFSKYRDGNRALESARQSFRRRSHRLQARGDDGAKPGPVNGFAADCLL